MTLLDKLRGKPWIQITDLHATIYGQGVVLFLLLVVAIAIVGPKLAHLNFGFGVVISMFSLLFSTALAVRFELPDGSEI